MHYLLKKKAMDAMNEALNKPTEYPAADKDYDHPMWFKGTEPESIKHASIDDYIRLADKVIADMKRLAEIAPAGSDIQALASADSQDLQYFLNQAKGTSTPGPRMARFRGSSRRADVKMHTEPRVLPPRSELRTHLDDEVKNDLKKEKEAAKSIELTPEQDLFWVKCFEFYSGHGHSEVKAVRMADRETVKKWPELAKFRHWTDPLKPEPGA